MTENDIDAKMSRQPIERYQWPLAAGLVLLAASMLINERRRASRMAAALAVAFALAPANAEAAQENPKQLYSAGRYEDAQKAYEQGVQKDPESEALAFNWGAAAYKNKDYDTALQAFSQALTTDDEKLRAKAEYNLANTLLQKGAPKMEEKPLRDALAHYDQALKLRPDDADALHNKKFTEDLLAKLKEQQQQQKQDQKDDKKDDQKKDEKDQQKQDKQDKGDKKDEQQQQGGDQQKQDKDQQGEKSDQQKQDGQESKDQQGKDGEKKDQKEGGQKDDPQKEKKDGDKGEQAKNDPKQGKDGAKPEPMPEQPGDKKPTGELKANPSQPQPGEPQDPQAEAEADEAAAAEGKMTERQAKALLDSLKSEDDRVRLIDPKERQRAGRALRDW